MKNIKNISDSKLEELLSLLHLACQILGTEDSFCENIRDADYVKLFLVKMHVIDEIQNRAKPAI